MHRKFRRKPHVALERNAADGTGISDGDASDNDFECVPTASKKHTHLFILKVTLQQAQTHFMNFHQSLNLLLGKHFLAVSIDQQDESVFKKVGAKKKYFFS